MKLSPSPKIPAPPLPHTQAKLELFIAAVLFIPAEILDHVPVPTCVGLEKPRALLPIIVGLDLEKGE
jgi:hypothetical protein